MTKQELISAISEKANLSKENVNTALVAIVEVIKEVIASGKRVAIPDFGIFEKVERPAREGRNPKTGETIQIKAKSVPKFKPSKVFKDFIA